eukprot:3641352-Prymnesium_polylepis.1
MNDERFATIPDIKVTATMAEETCTLQLGRTAITAAEMLREIGFSQVESGNWKDWTIELAYHERKEFDITPAYLKRCTDPEAQDLYTWKFRDLT